MRPASLTPHGPMKQFISRHPSMEITRETLVMGLCTVSEAGRIAYFPIQKKRA